MKGFACALLIAAVAGCSGDEEGVPNGTSSGVASSSGGGSSGAAAAAAFAATVQGSPSGATELRVDGAGAYAEYRQTPAGERLSVHANVPAGDGQFGKGEQSLRIFLQPYGELGTYTFAGDANIGGAYAERDKTHVFYAQYGADYAGHGSGSITVETRSESRLTGRFSFIAQDDAKATSVTVEGTFDLPLVADGG